MQLRPRTNNIEWMSPYWWINTVVCVTAWTCSNKNIHMQFHTLSTLSFLHIVPITYHSGEYVLNVYKQHWHRHQSIEGQWELPIFLSRTLPPSPPSCEVLPPDEHPPLYTIHQLRRKQLYLSCSLKVYEIRSVTIIPGWHLTPTSEEWDSSPAASVSQSVMLLSEPEHWTVCRWTDLSTASPK